MHDHALHICMILHPLKFDASGLRCDLFPFSNFNNQFLAIAICQLAALFEKKNGGKMKMLRKVENKTKK